MQQETILDVENINKTYKSAGKSLTVLHQINFSIIKGSTVAITGPSGSGKTTLLGLCAGLDQPTSGEIILNGNPLSKKSEYE